MKIYFDMDGVLADFDTAVAPFSDGRTDLNNQSKLMGADARDAKRARWQRIEQSNDFWANIPVMDDIENLLNAAAARAELFVLTSVPGEKHFIGGGAYVDFIEAEKRAWIARYFGKFFAPQNVIVARVPKEELICPSASDILIDDRAGNVADWCAAGGRGIVFNDVNSAIKDLTSGHF